MRPLVHVALRLEPDEARLREQQLNQHGFNVRFARKNLTELLPDCRYLLVGRPPRIDWSPAQKLELLQIAGAGVDPLFPAQGLSEKTLITNCRGTHADAVRDHVLSELLAFARDLPRSLEQQARQKWQAFAMPSLTGKKLTLLGFGAVGSRVAAVGKTLGMTVCAVRRSPRAAAGADEVYAPENLHAALSDTDYLVVCLPLTSETHQLVGAHALTALPARAVLIDVSRGGIVDQRALEAALRAGRLSGAALDVFEQEPLSQANSLWSCPRLIITPHIAGWTPDYIARVFDVFIENVARVRRGDEPINTVSRAAEY